CKPSIVAFCSGVHDLTGSTALVSVLMLLRSFRSGLAARHRFAFGGGVEMPFARNDRVRYGPGYYLDFDLLRLGHRDTSYSHAKGHSKPFERLRYERTVLVPKLSD